MNYVLHTVLEGFDPAVAAAFLLASDALAVATMPSVLLRRRGRPLAAVAWLLALFALPYLGVLAWWLLGRTYLEKKVRRREAAAQVFGGTVQRTSDPKALEAFRGILPPAVIEGRRNQPAFPPTTGNRATLLVDGPKAFAAMEDAIADAQQHVHALFYIWKPDRIGRRLTERLVERAKRGVEVRVLVDAFGSPRLRGEVIRPLEEAGARVSRFLPPRYLPWSPTFNFRNHRKLLLIDGRIAFTGGMNVADEYATDWHDLAVRIEGPAVDQMQDVFLEDWYFATGDNLSGYLRGPKPHPHGDGICGVVPSGPDQLTNWMQDAIFLSLTRARDRIWLTTPYFVPSAPIVAALRGAAHRGVDVRLLVPRYADVPLVRFASRAYYPRLYEAGVRIYEYEGTVLHAKALVVDRDLTVLGSANVDVRSFRLNFEMSVFTLDTRLNAELATVFEADIARSHELTGDDVRQPPGIRTLLESLAHLASPLL